jgi:hypothetical protein
MDVVMHACVPVLGKCEPGRLRPGKEGKKMHRREVNLSQIFVSYGLIPSLNLVEKTCVCKKPHHTAESSVDSAVYFFKPN